MPRFVQTGVIDSQLDGREVVVRHAFGRLGAPWIIVVINNIYRGEGWGGEEAGRKAEGMLRALIANDYREPYEEKLPICIECSVVSLVSRFVYLPSARPLVGL